MKVLFDTSVLIPALVDQLANHEAALSCLVRHSSATNRGCCATHALAETYATLTALPLPKRVNAAEARTLVEESIARRLEVVELDRAAYLDSIARTAALGLISGQVYDALHLTAALKAGCKRIYTYNLVHFDRLRPDGIEVTAP